MSGNILGNKVDSKATKTLYTPVLYHHVPELSASSTGETARCSTYLKRLTREHLARASMEEIGSSAAFSPTSQARVSKWTAKVKRAFAEANGNAADGRWALVSDLLRLHCTRGGSRWLGVNLDLQAPQVPKQLCLIPKTSEEWDDLERRIKGEDAVSSKVQRWIRSAEFTPLSPSATVDQSQTLHGVSSLLHRDPNPSTKVTQTSLTGFSMSHPLSSGSKFGFNVVKRPNVFIKGTNRSRNSLSSPPPPDPIPPSTSHIPNHSDHEPSHQTVHPLSPIIDQNLKPLPFPDSQIQTSTPLPNPQDDIQNSNLSCEPSPAAPGHASFSDQTHREGDVASNRKRARSGSLEPPVTKRARSAVEEIGHPSSSQFQPEAVEPQVTPSTVRNLPRLTELLALSPHQKHNTPRKGALKLPANSPSPIHTSDARDRPETLIISLEPQVKDPDFPAINSPRAPVSEVPLKTLQLGASTPEISSDIAGHGNFVDPPPAIQPSIGSVLEEEDDVPLILEEALKVHEPQPHPPPQKDQLFFPVDPKLLMSKLNAKTYNLYGLDLLDDSPAKSLSSLAGSDADSDSDSDSDPGKATHQTLEKIIEIMPEQLQHPIDPDFNPCATSTQKPGLDINLASTMSLSGHPTLDNLNCWGNDQLPSASQLQAEVNGQVNEFDKFMEADLSYDQVVSEF